MPAIFCCCPNCDAEQTCAPSFVGQTGQCTNCGSSMTFFRDTKPAERRGVALWEEIEEADFHQKTISALKTELSKKKNTANVELIAARVLRIGHPVSDQEVKVRKKDAKKHDSITFRVDTVQCIQLAKADLLFHLLIPYSGSAMMAHEFVSTVPSGFSKCLFFDRDGPNQYKQGQFVLADGQTASDETLIKAAEKASPSLVKGIIWNTAVETSTQWLQWGLQLVPHQERTIHIIHTARLGIFTLRFDPSWYLERREAFIKFAQNFPPYGPVEAVFRHSPLTLLFLDSIIKSADVWARKA